MRRVLARCCCLAGLARAGVTASARPCLPWRRPPTIQGVTRADTSASLTLTFPAAKPSPGADWAKFELAVCTEPGTCPTQDCTTGTCTLALAPNTAYTIKAVAVSGATRSLEASTTLRTLFP